MASELISFVKEALAAGQDRGAIKQALLSAGWDEKEIQKAVDSFADVDFAIPVPRKKPYLAAREAFLYLVSFIALYITAFSFGALLFSFVDVWFPDPVTFGAGRVSVNAIASLLVAFPLYLFITRYLRRAADNDPERKDSRIRKWLTYATLVVAAGVIIGDLIAVLSSLLGGELTVRFLVKALTVFAVSGAIFGFYLVDLQKEEKES